MDQIRWEECAYFMRGLPGADPEGTCSFGCREEPNCMTGRPAEGWSPWDAQVERLGSQCAALTAENARLRKALDDAQLRSIEARNPGIDMDEVRRLRAASQEDQP